MGYSRNALNAYKETRVRTASRGQLIVMLYDEAIRQIDAAMELLEGDSLRYDTVNEALTKAKDCITELMVSVDFEQGGEIAQNLFSLYSYFGRQILEANINKDVKLLRPVRRQLHTLREAWSEIAGRSQDGAAPSGGINVAG
ncbi:flagellar export chaperone FliS [Spirochaeta africana]|uniref:Flagellar secretion chaperone FliS n=1 Tax=Spirochaeta africana (strain ATCC 700263 / DSM 8902 / Z-7692) TaxID=889378 RepID=U3GJI9_SPIAZ|nr:flagellar export chaperone FliS [Spirochaeta africana]AFG38743.1 flagellar biosynthetic protein FliS [Spirochaeta africana DSM 8902]